MSAPHCARARCCVQRLHPCPAARPVRPCPRRPAGCCCLLRCRLAPERALLVALRHGWVEAQGGTGLTFKDMGALMGRSCERLARVHACMHAWALRQPALAGLSFC